MTRRRAVIGLSVLCSLVFCAVAAPNAMALKGTTAYTCIAEPDPGPEAVGFSEEHCTKGAEGKAVKFIHAELPAEITQLEVDNNETPGKPIPTKLLFELKGAAVELESNEFASCMGHTSVRNKDNGEKPMEMQIPEFCGEWQNVGVKKGANCVVEEGKIILLNQTTGKEPERGNGRGVVVANGGKEEMYVEFNPYVGKPFASFTLEKCKEAFLNKTYKVEGTAKANVTTNVNQLDGPTLRFTTADTGKTLKVNTAEDKVEGKLEGTFTASMLLNGSEENNPVVSTTTE